MRSAIYGAGSLGTVLGAYLSRNGVEIDLINRNRDHVEALNRNGARITGTVDMTVPVKALLPEDMTGTYDIIFLGSWIKQTFIFPNGFSIYIIFYF